MTATYTPTAPAVVPEVWSIRHIACFYRRSKVPEGEYRVMSMRFGFGDFVGSPYTLEEVADKENVTRERVR